MQEETTVLSNEQAGAGCRRLRLVAPGIASAAVPGQFVHVRVPGFDPAALRRPISICDADAAAGVLTLLFKVVGRGTEALALAAPGARVDLLGPLGNGFPAPMAPESEERRAKSEDEAAGSSFSLGGEVLLVGGGYGVAPLFFLARLLIAGGQDAARIHLFAGGRTAADLLLLDDFRALGVDVRPATDDGSLGVRGLVTAPLDVWLDGFPGTPPLPGQGAPSPAPGETSPFALRSPLSLFACGPAPMLRALDGRSLARGFPAWLSLDRRMACGVGACFGCVQRVRAPGGGETLARVCADGPVFPAGRIVWD